MSAAPARVATRRYAQPELFETEPYRVAAKRPRPRRAHGNTLATIPRPTPRPAPRASQVAAASTPEAAPSVVPFVALCVSIVVAALVAVLLLNVSMTSRAYEARNLRAELADLQEQRQELALAIDERSAPDALGQAAADLGMAPAGSLVFLTLPDDEGAP